MEAASRAGAEMSLAALRRHDPYITSIADLTGQVALYTFSPEANQWEKTDIEGTLFVYRRSASPFHGFTIVNRLNMTNLVEPVNKDLEFQLHEPFLLYRNASLSIYSIWFYDKDDCHRIAKLMAKVVEQETQRSQRAASDRPSPSRANGHCDKRPIDILEMLSKAKDEYERNQITDSTISSPGLQPSTRLTNPGSAEETSEEMSPGLQTQEKPAPSGHKHLTVEELFGTSLPKEQPTIIYPSSEGVEKLPADTSPKEHDLFSPFSFESSRGTHQPENPIVQSSSPNMGQQEAPAPIAPPDRKSSVSCTVPMSPSVKAAPAAEVAGSPALKKAAQQRSPLLAQPAPELRHKARNLITTQSQFVAPLSGTSPGSTSSASLLHKLQLTPQPSSLTKNPIAPHFASSASQLATPESFKEPHARRRGTTATLGIPGRPSLKVSSPKFITSTTSASSSILLSPSVFQQSATKPTELEKKASSPSRSSGASENPTKPPLVLSRSQLQDTLIHLIKNDASFLSTLHEVYLQVLTKNINNLQL
ncbi:mRNA-decapping enzyme 1A [Dromiciops gliroides]|uniref:mRNA-decapping enzyme 1A n=1 Tax=Dromiciops gliroides TaxID=33562 RepID=UPI001CC756D7|nr:mRNA-decapping enzyme 1A [Dromiciops gliroides]